MPFFFRRPWGYFTWPVLSGTIFLLGATWGLYLWTPYAVKLFETAVSQMERNTELYDVHGRVFAAIAGNERREWRALKDISPYVQKAAIAIEDKRFFSHKGIDPRRILGALKVDLQARAFLQGGSTITQQLVKLTLLSPQRSLRRKFREVFMALALERAYSKEQLLGFYLNRIYLGNGLYGIAQASQAYFDKSAAGLNLSEAAFLAALIQKPEGYLRGARQHAASVHYDITQLAGLFARWKQVLHNLHTFGWISPMEYQQALATPPTPKRSNQKHLNIAPYFVQAVRKNVRENQQDVYLAGGGYRIQTSLNLDLQRAADESLAALDKQIPQGAQVALVAMDVLTGEVRAMVGGRDFETSPFNRATQAKRQPGSAFKPVLYAAALKRGFKPYQVFLDAPFSYRWNEQESAKDWKGVQISLADAPSTSPGKQPSLVRDDETGWVVYTPSNYKHRYGLLPRDTTQTLADQRMSLSLALQRSSNVIAVQVLQQLGQTALLKQARAMGLNVRKNAGLCVALGCAEMSLLELTSAYAAFANGGWRVHPQMVRQISDARGVLNSTFPPEQRRAMDPWTAYRMRWMLSGVLTHGTGVRARIDGPAGGKTGTNDGPRDAWFIGFTPSLVVGVWIGSDTNLVFKHLTGGGLPARWWRKFMQRAKPFMPDDTNYPPLEQEYITLPICQTNGSLNAEKCPLTLPTPLLEDEVVQLLERQQQDTPSGQYQQDLWHQVVPLPQNHPPTQNIPPPTPKNPGEPSPRPSQNLPAPQRVWPPAPRN